MGCDIHFHIEVKINKEWHHYASPDVNRWYDLFGALAGVRSSEKPIVQQKGFPKDASLVTKVAYEYMKEDAHSPSWLNSNEIIKLEKWLDKKQQEAKEEDEDIEFFQYDLEYTILNTYFFGNSFTGWKQEPFTKPSEIEDVRFVFWFDN